MKKDESPWRPMAVPIPGVETAFRDGISVYVEADHAGGFKWSMIGANRCVCNMDNCGYVTRDEARKAAMTALDAATETQREAT